MTASPALMKAALSSSLDGEALKVVRTYFQAVNCSAVKEYDDPFLMMYSAFL